MHVIGGGWVGEGGAGGGGGWEARGRLNPPIKLFGLAISPRSASHRPQTCFNGVRDVSLSLG